MTRVVPGQLWCEARNVDTCAFRTVRWLIVVRVDGDRVSTVDVDHDAWHWRPTLQSWGLGDAPLVEVRGPYRFTTVAALQHPHFIQLADPRHVGCVLPGDVPVQGSLFELPPAVA